jgi:phospholipase C
VSYWDDTAIIVTWANWGGWYDHESPDFVTVPSVTQSDFQDGFRVPLIFVSAYTPQGFIDNVSPLDYATIVRFVEGNFGFAEGALGYADARNPHDLNEFYNFNAVTGPRQFVPIPTH